MSDVVRPTPELSCERVNKSERAALAIRRSFVSFNDRETANNGATIAPGSRARAANAVALHVNPVIGIPRNRPVHRHAAVADPTSRLDTRADIGFRQDAVERLQRALLWFHAGLRLSNCISPHQMTSVRCALVQDAELARRDDSYTAELQRSNAASIAFRSPTITTISLSC